MCKNQEEPTQDRPSGSFRETADNALGMQTDAAIQGGAKQLSAANIDYAMQQRLKAQALTIIGKISKIRNMRTVFVVTQEHDMDVGLFITKEYGPYSIADLISDPRSLLRTNISGLRVICA